MPTYDYQCRSCGHTIEVIHSMTEQGPSTCERCGGELRRVLFPTGIIFKGSGFYKTDSRASASSPAKPAAKAAEPAKSADAPASTGDAPSSPPSTPKAAKGDGAST